MTDLALMQLGEDLQGLQEHVQAIEAGLHQKEMDGESTEDDSEDGDQTGDDPGLRDTDLAMSCPGVSE